MKNTVLTLRERLFSIIRRLGEEPERYARKPGRGFTRKRTLTPAVLIQLIVTVDEKSVWKGLFRHFRRRIDTPSASAFVQQRQKLLPSALEDLFHRFSDQLRPQKKFRGYRLLAADGSSLKSGAYPADKDAYHIKFECLMKRRGKKRATIVIARMILTAIYAMLSTGEIFNPSNLKKFDMPEDLKRSGQAACFS